MDSIQINWVIPIASVVVVAVVLAIGFVVHRGVARRRGVVVARRSLQDEMASMKLDPRQRRVLTALAQHLDHHVDPVDLLRSRSTFETALHGLLEQLRADAPQQVRSAARALAPVRERLGFRDVGGADFVSTRQIAWDSPVQIGDPGEGNVRPGRVGPLREDALELEDVPDAPNLAGAKVVVSFFRDSRRYQFESPVIGASGTTCELRHTLKIVDADVRGDLRVPLSRPIGYRLAGDPESRPLTAALVDLSVGGAAIRTRAEYEVREGLELDMEALVGEPEEDEEPWRIRATVVGSSHEAGEWLYHLQFRGHDASRARLFALVNDLDRVRREA